MISTRETIYAVMYENHISSECYKNFEDCIAFIKRDKTAKALKNNPWTFVNDVGHRYTIHELVIKG
jgi:hypothetical protein